MWFLGWVIKLPLLRQFFLNLNWNSAFSWSILHHPSSTCLALLRGPSAVDLTLPSLFQQERLVITGRTLSLRSHLWWTASNRLLLLFQLPAPSALQYQSMTHSNATSPPSSPWLPGTHHKYPAPLPSAGFIHISAWLRRTARGRQWIGILFAHIVIPKCVTSQCHWQRRVSVFYDFRDLMYWDSVSDSLTNATSYEDVFVFVFSAAKRSV